MASPDEYEPARQRLVIAHYADPNPSVWDSPNGIGELELFPNFRVMFRGSKEPLHAAVSIPEAMLTNAGFIFPEARDPEEVTYANLRSQPDPTPIDDRVPRVDALVETTEKITDKSFIGASVEGCLPDDRVRRIGMHVLPIADYVQEGFWGAPDIIPHLSYHGWLLEDYATAVAYTIQAAAEQSS